MPIVKLPKWAREVGWRTVVGALLLGSIIHIIAIFVVPVFGSGSAMQRLRDALPLNRMVVVPPPAPGQQLLPFMTPDALYAMCRYDLTGGSVTVTIVLADAGWTLSLHTPQGDNFYAMPAQQLGRKEISFLLVPGTERALELMSARRTPNIDTQVASPSVEGLLVVRAPLKGVAWRADTEALLGRASCTQVKR